MGGYVSGCGIGAPPEAAGEATHPPSMPRMQPPWLSRVQPPEPRHAIGLFQFTSSARKSLKPMSLVICDHCRYCSTVHGLCLKVRQSIS